MKSEEPPVIPPSNSDENLLENDNVDEQEDESDGEEEELEGDFDEQGKVTVDSRKSHDWILTISSVGVLKYKHNFQHNFLQYDVSTLICDLEVLTSVIIEIHVKTFSGMSEGLV